MGQLRRSAAFVSAYTDASNVEVADIDRRLGAARPCIQSHGNGTQKADIRPMTRGAKSTHHRLRDDGLEVR